MNAGELPKPAISSACPVINRLNKVSRPYRQYRKAHISYGGSRGAYAQRGYRKDRA